MEQQISEGEPNLEQDIIATFDEHQYIKNKISGEFPDIPKDSIVLIFLGAFQQNFHTFYQHFQIKQVILDTNYYKLVRLEKQGKKSYLLNFPLILQYNYETNQIPLDLCISKIYAEKALQKMEKCKFQLIIDMQQLNGVNERERVQRVNQDQVASFGKYSFKDNTFLLLSLQNEVRWKLCKVNFFDNNNSSQQFQLEGINQYEVLKSIFKNKTYLSLHIDNSLDFLNYGKMVTYLEKQQISFTKKINLLLKEFQKLILKLQQMPIIESQDNTGLLVGNYLRELEAGINSQNNPPGNVFFKIFEVLTIINQLNQGDRAIELNQRIQSIESPQMRQFLQDNNIERISIQPFFNNEVLQKLQLIIKFLEQYHEKFSVIEIKNLKVNLKFWCEDFDEEIEKSIYDLKYIQKRIQKGPVNQIENGLYFIGGTKSGKSTIMNIIFNPDKVQKEKLQNNECYGIKQEFETKFKIDHGGVSMTQKISGIYIGQKVELNTIFYNQENDPNINQQQEDVFSSQDLLDMGLTCQTKIPERWFIFDCPGFDDNSDKLMPIVHRISLCNYLKKTTNIFVFFVVDISIPNIQNIKNTFDPVYSLLKQRNDLYQHSKRWSNLILTKANNDSRQYTLANWQYLYRGELESSYPFYKQLLADDERCLQFLKPPVLITEEIKMVANSIIKIAFNQLQQGKYNPEIQLYLDDKFKMLYTNCMPKIKKKLEQLLQQFLSNLDEYIVLSNDTLNVKLEQIKKLKNCLFHQQSNQIINEINQDNSIYILQKLSQWIEENQYIRQNCFFLQVSIQDIEVIFQMSKSFESANHIMKFQVEITKLVNKIEAIFNQIKKTEDEIKLFQKIAVYTLNTVYGPIVHFSLNYYHNTKVICKAVVRSLLSSNQISKILYLPLIFQVFQEKLEKYLLQAFYLQYLRAN